MKENSGIEEKEKVIMLNPNRAEVYRYLGYRGNMPDDRMIQVVEQCINELIKESSPKFVCKELNILIENQGKIQLSDIEIVSKNLSKNLAGCEKVILFAATLGVGADRLISRAAVAKPSEMLIYQAASAAMIEAFCNYNNSRLKREYESGGSFLRPRFSPGYGDFSLGHQKDILQILNAAKIAGITLTESLLMMPSKSVTAVIGVSNFPNNCDINKCDMCEKKDCEYSMK